MEDALALFIQNTGGSGGHVLILVVMEDALALKAIIKESKQIKKS